jgi:hypothetical protein
MRQDGDLVRCRLLAVNGKQRLSKHGYNLIVHAACNSSPGHDISCAADAFRKSGNEAEPAIIRTAGHFLNTIFLEVIPEPPLL